MTDDQRHHQNEYRGTSQRDLHIKMVVKARWSLTRVNKYDSRTLNTSSPRQNGRHFPDDIFKCIFLNENACIYIKISLKFVFKVRINNIPALIQIMAWRRPGDKPLCEPMMVRIPTHLCVTQPQWVKRIFHISLVFMNFGFTVPFLVRKDGYRNNVMNYF